MKKGIISLLLIASMTSLIGCEDMPNISAPNSNNTTVKEEVKKTTEEMREESIETLNNAKEILVIKDLFSFTNSFTIKVDNESFGEIGAKFFKATGDKFTLKDSKGNEISSEQQIKRWNVKFNRSAEVYDYNGDVTGYIGEEVIKDMFKIGRTFHFFDKDKNKIGTSKQKVFSVMDNFEVYDTNNTLCYKIRANFNIMTNEYAITIFDNTTIPVDQVIYLTAIMDSIKRAEQEKSNN